MKENYAWFLKHTYQDRWGAIRCCTTKQGLRSRVEHRMRPAEADPAEPYRQPHTVELGKGVGTLISFSIYLCEPCNEGAAEAPDQVSPDELVFVLYTNAGS